MTKILGSAFLLGMMLIAAFVMTGCEGDQGPIGPLANAGDLTCAECHNSTNVIAAKHTQWAESVHGMGEAYLRGTSAGCAGCHSGGAFQAMIAAGQDPGTVTEGDPDPTRQDCRACHMIHTSYTAADWALRTMAPVDFYAIEGVTFDGGKGNLCANCHQPRRLIPDPVEGTISGISSHWGPHHGPQSAMLMGLAGAGGVVGTPATHYFVEDSCVHCHVGDDYNHTFEPDVAACQQCHPGTDTFDIDDFQSDLQADLDILGERLLALGLINENSPDGHPTVSSAPTAQAQALWNWLYIAHEDKSVGAHNPNYARALVDASLALVPAPPAK